MPCERSRRHKDKILLVPTGIACGDPATPPRGGGLKQDSAVSQPQRQESTPQWVTTTAWFVMDRAALEAQGLTANG